MAGFTEELKEKNEALAVETRDGKFLIYNGNLYMKMELSKPEGNEIQFPKYISKEELERRKSDIT